MAVQIVCANKPSGNLHDPHEAISHYGWVEDGTNARGIWPRQRMVDWVNTGGVAYVQDPFGRKATCYIRTSRSGIQFLQTYRDGDYANDLVSLSSCQL